MWLKLLLLVMMVLILTVEQQIIIFIVYFFKVLRFSLNQTSYRTPEGGQIVLRIQKMTAVNETVNILFFTESGSAIGMYLYELLLINTSTGQNKLCSSNLSID